MFTPRRGRTGHRFVTWQLGLFFVAAGVWVAGLIIGVRQLTLVSMALLLVAIVLGVIGRRSAEVEDD